MKKILLLVLTLGTSLFISCNSNTKEFVVTVTNPIGLSRSSETVEVPKSALGIDADSLFLKYGIVDAETGAVVMYQHFDKDGDGVADVILFQPQVKPQGSKKYIVKPLVPQPEFKSRVFSRFVPERTDDYAWENDRVAFRTFGPKAQQMIEQNIPGGTLTSGIDCWMKKVDYPIINKWYEKSTTGKGSYHIDTGEGFDNYHVGASRGCGGFGVWKNDSLWSSKNFTAWKRVANGPIRTSFELSYADWKAGEQTIKEKQVISLDLGSSLSFVKIKLSGTDQISAGITLHEHKGAITADVKNGWFDYWEPHPDMKYEMGTALVVLPKYFKGYREYISGTPDHSHLFVDMKVLNNEVNYYTGFFWTGSSLFKNKADWENYLDEFATKVKNPLQVDIEKK